MMFRKTVQPLLKMASGQLLFRCKLIGVALSLLLIFGGIATHLRADDLSPGKPLKIPPFSEMGGQTEVSDEFKIFLSGIFSPPEAPPWVDIQDKEAVRQFYLTEYMASEGVDSEWTGDHASCNPGATSAAFKEAILRRINYFRAMSGVPAVQFQGEYIQKAQSAALMMSVNRQLNHTPPETWTCYTDDGYEGASSSNLFLGVYGPSAISGYMYDPGSGNYFVGHRRWILYPQTQYMGTGDIPPQNGYPSSNVLWVFDRDNMWGERPMTRESYVAWPPPGYVPRQVVYPRWSFAYPQADFSDSTVDVTRDDQLVGVMVNPIANGFGENTLVWELNESIPDGDVVYTVTLQNVVIDSIPQSFTYQVMIFDPNEFPTDRR